MPFQPHFDGQGGNVGLYPKFDPPAHMQDLGRVPGLTDQWNNAISHWFDVTLKAEANRFRGSGIDPYVQYFNPLKERPEGPVVEQPITWNAFPKELSRQFGREQALAEADRLWPLSWYRNYPPSGVELSVGGVLDKTFYRPHNEYCEWRVFRDAATGKIQKVVFVSEPPEFYRALWGGWVEGFHFAGDPLQVLALYREFVSPEVQFKDLIASETINVSGVLATKGAYNPYNKWNTTHGIMHLCSPPNTLSAEIQLGGDASVIYTDDHDRLLVEPDVLICSTGYGGPDRNSDPTIGGTVNALARMGARTTLTNPVGLYMDHIDLAGWTVPDGGSVTDLVKVVRGSLDLIERLEVEVPADRGFTLEEVSIAGQPIRFGGQIAECITVKLVATAILSSNPPKPTPLKWTRHAYIDPVFPIQLRRAVQIGKPTPPGLVQAFVDQGLGAVVDGENRKDRQTFESVEPELTMITRI
jgi:hypothetical protein